MKLYPDPSSSKLKNALAEKHGLSPDNVFIGNGSDEVLSFAFYAFFDDRDGGLLYPEHTYSFYPVYCDFYDIPYTRIEMTTDFSIRLDDYLNLPSCGVIFPNPNAPTGCALKRDEISAFMDSYPGDKVVIVDEAYIDFGAESMVPMIEKYKNLLVVQTFSKGGSLAGMRLGYALGDKALIDALITVKDSFNSYPVDTLAHLIGTLAVKDRKYYDKINGKIISSRSAFEKVLDEMGWDHLPSKSNFVFVKKKGLGGDEVYRKLRDRGILVRHFKHKGITDYLRITIGTEKEMAALTAAMREL